MDNSVQIVIISWPLIFWGVFGGALAEFLKLYNLRDKPKNKWPVHYFTKIYWILSIVMVLLGGVVVFWYQESGVMHINDMLAANIGATAPLIFARVLAKDPKIRT